MSAIGPTSDQLRGVTRLLILQATPFCNIDCSYCYLPNRTDRRRMNNETIRASVEWIYDSGLALDNLSLAWHAGEPLTLPPSWYRGAMAAARQGLPAGASLRHFMQTNAMLINDEWCEFFAEHDVQVGVSLDGPAPLHDLRRRTRSGKGTHAAALEGIRALRRHGIDTSALCVITEQSLDHPEAIVEFFAAEGIRELGFNVEEIEGANLETTLAVAEIEQRFRAFFERALDCALREDIVIREARDQAALFLSLPAGLRNGNQQNIPFANVTVTVDGYIHTFSPELVGSSHPKLGGLSLGHVERNSLQTILESVLFRQVWSEIAAGIMACADSCAYFPLCGGGAPSNKLAEHGAFDQTETLTCRLIQQQVAETALTRWERQAVERASMAGI